MVADIATSSQKDSYIGYASVGALGRGLASRSENALPELDVMAEGEDTLYLLLDHFRPGTSHYHICCFVIQLHFRSPKSSNSLIRP